MESGVRPFYLGFDEQHLRNLARSVPLLDDELLMLGFYIKYATANDSLSLPHTRLLDFILSRSGEHNINKLKSLPNIRRMIAQTAAGLSEKRFIEVDYEAGEILRIRLVDPVRKLLEEHYDQMLLNDALPFPEEAILHKYLLENQVFEVSVPAIANGSYPNLQKEERILLFRFAELPQGILATAATLDKMLSVCLLKLRNLMSNPAQGRLVEDVVKDLRNIMPHKTSTNERVVRVLSGAESEAPIYFVNLANRLAAYLAIDKERRGVATLLAAARLVEAFKGYEVWLESEKHNQERRRENILKILAMMAEYPALLNREGIIQKIVKGSEGLEVIASLLSQTEIEQLVQQMLSEYTVFQPEETGLLPTLVRFKMHGEDYFIHRESLLLFFESERKRIRSLLLSRLKKQWYSWMLRGESRPAMEFDEFFAQDIEKYVKSHEPVFTMLLQNPQAILNAFHISGRHRLSTNMQDLYFIFRNGQVYFRPVHSLLELVRRDIYTAVRRQLPLIYRFPLLRWLATLFGWIKPPPEPEKEAHDNTTTPSALAPDTDWHRTLSMVETRLIGEKNAMEMLSRYYDLWNIKLGESRRQLSEKIDGEIAARAKHLYTMLKKLPEVKQSFLASEIGNVATQLVRRFGKEVADTRALDQYIQLSLIEQLKSLHHG
ncbi:MAG: hypothetical protein N2Z22_09455 [Turneriella sp.]|nr:hypothetical protein [Turneriella sp.]